MSNLLAAMLQQYEKNSTRNTNESGTTYNEKNYFSTYIPDKVKSATKIIRILPTADGSSPFIEVHCHSIKIEGKDRKFSCPKHEKNEDCPFCEARTELLSTGLESDKELAKKYNARKMYVVKIIDREDESHGPKFWRFNHDWRKQGVYDKIMGVVQAIAKTAAKDFTDKLTGRDLMITINRDQNNHAVISTISHLDPSPLSEDETQANEWVSDNRTWLSVYSIKPYDYLEIIVKGGTPTWDKASEKFIDKASVAEVDDSDDDDAIIMGKQATKADVKNPVKVVEPVAEVVTSEDAEDDLPF
jgi:gp32 DNA binding protein like